jgi:uncharacterized protein with NAD-binding domain and iron-sulfur cluster
MNVVIIGGGPAALTAAFELTEPGRGDHQVTILQPGWRLGGKCASGRNRERGNRIEEHGLHIWFGAYDNAMALMKRCYRALGRDPDRYAFTSFDDAFEGVDEAVLWQRHDGEWSFKTLHFPRNPRHPRDLLRYAVAALGRAGARPAESDVRFYRDTLRVVRAALRGVWNDELLTRGFDSINHRDFADWLEGHGLELEPDPTDWPAILRAVYCGCFAFEDGDPGRPRIAAGRALQGAIRCLFQYRGSVLHRMRGAMGDVVIAPFYEVLARRGVEIRFFHAVKELCPDDDGAIAEIRGVRQLELAGSYHPLFDAEYVGPDGRRTVPSWPSEPLWEQLPDSHAEARDAPLRMEQEIDPFGGSEFRLRKRGAGDADHAEDVFDKVILAVPPDVQEEICGRLKARDPHYARMLDHTATVVTQAAQLWLDRSAGDLGQRFTSRSLMSCWFEPLDTYCDMAHLLPNEQWPQADRARHIAYFCGVLPTGTVSSQEDADAHAEAHLQGLLSDHGARLWPSAARPEGGLRYDALAPAREAASPTDSLGDQLYRANFAPSERYVLSLPGSIRHRLPADGTRFHNLILAGDWTVNGFDAGCLEGAVTSGMLASNAICGEPAKERIVGLGGPAGFPNVATRDANGNRAEAPLLRKGSGLLRRALTGAAGRLGVHRPRARHAPA